MSSNNLYGQLIDLAHEQNIELSDLSSVRSSTKHQVSPFFDKCDLIEEKIRLIRYNNEQVLQLKSTISTNSLPNRQKQLQDHIKSLCDDTYELGRELKLLFEESTALLKIEKEENPNEPQTMAKIYREQQISKKVQQILSDSYKIQKIIEKYSINTSLKRIKALAPEMQQEEAMRLARKKDGFEQIVMQKTMGKASLKLKYRVKDLSQKYEGIRQLEKAVTENMRLMNQISFLVQQQGEMIDSIYANVADAKDYIEKAEVNLKQEKKKHKSARKRQCCILFIGIIILALIVTPIVLVIVKKNQQK